jgi:hypothetical protein
MSWSAEVLTPSFVLVQPGMRPCRRSPAAGKHQLNIMTVSAPPSATHRANTRWSVRLMRVHVIVSANNVAQMAAAARVEHVHLVMSATTMASVRQPHAPLIVLGRNVEVTVAVACVAIAQAAKPAQVVSV